jgi:hypothetical protein
VTVDRERILSEFIDAWNAGTRPDVDDFLVRVPADEQGLLADELMAFLSFAPTPSYSDEAVAEIRAEPPVATALASLARPGGLLPSLLRSLRERLRLTPAQLAAKVAGELALPRAKQRKTASYLRRLEDGELDPERVSRRVFDALANVLGVPRAELESAGDLGGWGRRRAMTAAPVVRADDAAARAVSEHLDVLADALQAPGGPARDEVDELFLGGR